MISERGIYYVYSALHIPISCRRYLVLVVLCEQIADISTADRVCNVKGHLSGNALLEIFFRVQSIFDYVPHA